MNKPVLLLSYGAILVLDATTGMAQSDSDGTRGLEEIIVTARKQEESLRDVPVAVVAISPVELQSNLATDLSKVAELAPQVLIGRAINGTGAAISMRGISSTTADSGLDQSVSVVIDDVPLSRGRVISTSVFDMKQVEVMQGPQALFFGKNSPAGVISLRSADPTDHYEGYATGGYEFESGESYLEGAVSGPLTDTLRARLAVRGNDMNGWIRNVGQPIANPTHPASPLPGAWDEEMPKGYDLATRLTLLWNPSDDFDAKFKLMLDKQRLNSNGAYVEGFCISPTTVPVELGVPMPGADCKKDKVTAQSALPAEFAVNYPYANGGVPYALSEFALASLNLNKTEGAYTLTSTTGYYNQLLEAAHTSDFSPFAQAYNVERERYKILTQEFRLRSDFSSPINFMLGMYIESADRDWFGAPDVFSIFNPVAQNYTTAMLNTNSKNKSWSVFGQFRWAITPSLELAAGARYTEDDKETTYLNEANNTASPIGRTLYPTGRALQLTYVDDNVSPEVTITWKLNGDQTLYGAYKTGYKAGGFSNPVLMPANATEQSLDFGPEEADGFEIGYKAYLLDRTLSADLVAYRYDYDGLQVTAFDPVLLRLTVGNAANARTTGFTGLFNWLATDSLTLNGNVGYNKAEYLSFKGSQCYTGQTAATGCVGGVQDLSGKALVRAPEWSFSLGADYRANLMQDWFADLSISSSYTDSYMAQADYGPGGFQEAFWRLNAAVKLGPNSEKFEVALVGRNLTDAYYMSNTFGWPFGGLWQYGGVFNRPREVALQGTYRF